jgi:succinylarginine dihydrolase
LDKMRIVAERGAHQYLLPPQPRPDLAFLESLGFDPPLDAALAQTFDQAPDVLSAAMSCSAMWTANAATVCPVVDSRDGRLTLVTANLQSSLHRAIESAQTTNDLKQLLGTLAKVRPAVLGGAAMRDEGAANHMRLGNSTASPGIHLFVYGDGDPRPQEFWPRQTLAACQAVCRRLGIARDQAFFLKQHPDAIDAGAFHNDVVATSHQGLLIHHQTAYLTDPQTWPSIARRYRDVCGQSLRRIEVAEQTLSLADAVQTYLFNSQIISSPEPATPPILICPRQVQEHAAAERLVGRWLADGLFSEAHFVELRQSMAGGGGPACLRLRIPLQEDRVGLLPEAMRWTAELDDQLRQWIDRDYPRRLCLADLVDAQRVEGWRRLTDEMATRLTPQR